MAGWTVFDLYEKQTKNGTFSAVKKREAYKGYQGQVRARYLAREKNKSYYTNTSDRIKYVHEQIPADPFYVRSSQIRDAVLADFGLLESLIKDEILFSRLTQEERDRIRYYHYDYATLLMDDAAVSNGDYDAAKYPDINVTGKYQKIIQDYAKEYNLEEKNEVKSVAEATTGLLAPEIEIEIEIETGTKNTAGEKKQNKAKSAFFLSMEWAIYGYGVFNIYRLLITFLRYTWFYFVAIARSMRWLEAIPLAVDADLLMAPTPIFNILSVMLFLGRLVFDVAMILVHTFLPTEAEKEVNFVERFWMECRKRYRRMVNDFAWSSFNALTNFAWFFSIPIPVAGPLLVCFLAFDIYWFAHKWKQDELAIKEQQNVLEALLDSLKPSNKDEVVSPIFAASVSGKAVSTECEVAADTALDAQDEQNNIQSDISFARLRLRQLECSRAQTRAEYVFCLAAAGLLVLSFALFLPFMASPLAAPICFFGCAFAVAMYINCGNVGAAWRARHERNLSKNEAHGDQHKFELKFLIDPAAETEYQQLRQKDYNAKCRKLAFGFAESLIVTAVIIALYTINWPAALALTLTYMLVKSGALTPVKNRFFPPTPKEKTGQNALSVVGDKKPESANDAMSGSSEEQERLLGAAIA